MYLPKSPYVITNIIRGGAWLCSMLLLVLLLPLSLSAQTIRQFDTRYYTIIFDEDGEYTAGQIARFCDDIYEDLLARYGAFSDDPRVTCIVNDAVDLANGYAVHFENTITIYATNMDFELRGQSSWLRNVFVHEMTHMIALKKAAKGPVNLVMFGGAQYNENPDIMADLAWYHVAQPAWFSEGTAQLGAETFGSESWDTHRDMLLRSAWLDGTLLTLTEMNTLSGRTSLGAEQVYNQGYALIRYIRDTWGDEAVMALNNTGAWSDFAPTIKKVLGISAQELYDRWMASLDEMYAPYNERAFVTGERVADLGSTNHYPALSPDGRSLAFLSNRGRDHTITDLMLMDMTTGKVRKLVDEVDYRVTWSPDSAMLVYVRRPDSSPRFYDIHTYDIATGTERRISKNLRARDPAFSPDGSSIVFVRNAQGQNQLGVMNADGSDIRYLTGTVDGTQFYAPSYAPDSAGILFSVYRQEQDRDIARIDADAPGWRHEWERPDSSLFASGSGFQLLVASAADERDPWYAGDGTIIYASDRSGVFNLYRLDPETGLTTRITDCPGGAFAPQGTASNGVCYAGYTGEGFSIYRIDAEQTVEQIGIERLDRFYHTQKAPFDIDDYFTVTSYRPKRVVEAVVPTFSAGPSFIGSRFGLDVVNVGAQVYLADVLGTNRFMAGGSVGKNLREEVDLNNSFAVAYERSMLPVTSSGYAHSPTFFAEASRTVINNHIGRLDTMLEGVAVGDIPDLGLTGVIQDFHQSVTIADEYRDEFRRFRAGMRFPLANRHQLTFEAGYRQYRETLLRHQTVRDFTQYYHEGDRITDEVGGAGGTLSESVRYFTDIPYFKSAEFGVGYSYVRSEPAADNDLAPKGTAISVTVRHLKSAITDSLVDQVTMLVPTAINFDGSIQLGEYLPDPFADQLRPITRDTDINEFTASARKSTRLPWLHHTLDLEVIGAYRDISLKDTRKNEGSGYNWPLKYYLGGANLLSGYPYFAFWGTKLAYVRAEYVAPVWSGLDTDMLGVQVQKLYGAVTFEAANVWNFDRLSADKLAAGQFKRDVCMELRLGMVAFYRFPAIAFARIAWPLDDMSGSSYENDDHRLYFGVRM